MWKNSSRACVNGDSSKPVVLREKQVTIDTGNSRHYSIQKLRVMLCGYRYLFVLQKELWASNGRVLIYPNSQVVPFHEPFLKLEALCTENV
jgi:hypothetical protein